MLFSFVRPIHLQSSQTDCAYKRKIFEKFSGKNCFTGARSALDTVSTSHPCHMAEAPFQFKYTKHFLQEKWAAEFPTTSNALMNRHEELSTHDTEIQDYSYAFNKKIATYERQLANKQENAVRKRGRLNLMLLTVAVPRQRQEIEKSSR